MITTSQSAVPSTSSPSSSYELPLNGAADPGDGQSNVTTPGTSALAADIGGPRMFSSPDTPGMPEVSPFTAWDFLPEGWTVEIVNVHQAEAKRSAASDPSVKITTFTDARGIS